MERFTHYSRKEMIKSFLILTVDRISKAHYDLLVSHSNMSHRHYEIVALPVAASISQTFPRVESVSFAFVTLPVLSIVTS